MEVKLAAQAGSGREKKATSWKSTAFMLIAVLIFIYIGRTPQNDPESEEEYQPSLLYRMVTKVSNSLGVKMPGQEEQETSAKDCLRTKIEMGAPPDVAADLCYDSKTAARVKEDLTVRQLESQVVGASDVAAIDLTLHAHPVQANSQYNQVDIHLSMEDSYGRSVSSTGHLSVRLSPDVNRNSGKYTITPSMFRAAVVNKDFDHPRLVAIVDTLTLPRAQLQDVDKIYFTAIFDDRLSSEASLKINPGAK